MRGIQRNRTRKNSRSAFIVSQANRPVNLIHLTRDENTEFRRRTRPIAKRYSFGVALRLDRSRCDMGIPGRISYSFSRIGHVASVSIHNHLAGVAASGCFTPMSDQTILVIDDEEAVRFSASEALRVAGYKVIEAASSDDALQIIRFRAPDLIICDVRMETEDDGFDALKSVRRDPQLDSIPFILITGGYDSKVIRRGMNDGANDFLVKPFSPRQLVASVSACLSRDEPHPDTDVVAPHRLLDMVNDVPMLVGSCDPVSTRFEFLNRFGMNMLQLDDAENVPQIAFSEICDITNGEQDFAETWEATRKNGAWSGEASFRIGKALSKNVSLFLTAHRDPGTARHFVTVLARNLASTTSR